MKQVITELNFSLSDTGYQHVLNICKTDYDSRCIVASFRDDGGHYSLDGITKVILRAKKPDGTYIYTYCQKSGDTAEYTPGRVILAAAGEVQCQFVLIGGNGEEISSPKFKINVTSPTVEDSELTGLSDYSSLTEQVAETEEYASRAEAAAILSETYSDEAAASAAAVTAEISELNEALSGYLPIAETNLNNDEQITVQRNIGIPSDWGVYENITVSSAVNEVARSSETGGAPYNLKNVIITVSLPTPQKLNFQGQSTGGGALWIINSEKEKKCFVLRSMLLFGQRMTFLSEHESAATTGGSISMYGDAVSNSVGAFQIRPQVGYTIPSGTVIRIYGVRE